MVAAAVVLVLFAPSLRLAFILPTDVPLFVCIGLGILAIVLNAPFAGVKNFSTTMAWLVTVMFFFLLVRNWLLLSLISIEDISKAAAATCIGLSLFIVSEFIVENAFGLNLTKFIFPFASDLPPIDLLPGWSRPRGLAAEPGFTAMVFEAILPLAWIRYGRHWRSAALLLAIVLPGFTLLGSVGSFVAIALTLSVVTAIRGGTPRIWLSITLGWVFLIGVVLQTDAGKLLFNEIILRKLVELFGGGVIEASGPTSRFEAYRAGFQILLQRPMGIGWGMVSQMYADGMSLPGLPAIRGRGLLSLFLETAVSAGWIGLVALLLFLGTRILQLIAIRTWDSTCVLFALLTLLFHHAVLLEFWFPMLWLILAIADCLAYRATVVFSVIPPVPSGYRKLMGVPVDQPDAHV
ncbi:MAG: hypothetical protein R3F24_11990 [Gammaproteobacteria bacterium]